MRVLLIAPTFFGYRDLVRDELARLGHEVHSMNDRPSEKIWFKSIAKYGYRYLDRMIARYADQVITEYKNGNYDLVIYMGGMSFCFTREQFQAIRNAGNTPFIAYLWDAFSNCQRFGACSDLFDRVYSFEPQDCKRFNLLLRPLFYSNIYKDIPLEPAQGFEYDACFVGSVHQPSKFYRVSAICDQLEEQGYKVCRYFYMPSYSIELKRKLSDSRYRRCTFQHKVLSPKQVANLYLRSRVVIDSPQRSQLGLTMRTIETLGARRKLITVNTDIQHYDFARYDNILLWQNDTEAIHTFLHKKYNILPQKIYDNYSIEAFVKTLLGEVQEYTGYSYSVKGEVG